MTKGSFPFFRLKQALNLTIYERFFWVIMEGRALPLQKIGSFSYIDSSIILGGNATDIYFFLLEYP